MGFAYAPSGNVSATVTVNGSQVFSGDVTTSNTPRESEPVDNTQLLSFDLDENTTNLSVSVTVSGGELCWGRTKTTASYNYYIDRDYHSTLADPANVTLEEQQAIATGIGESALGSSLYNDLMAGNISTPTAEQQTAISTANQYVDYDNDFWHERTHLTNPQLNGSAWTNWDSDTMGEGNIFVLADGDTLTYTWTCDLDHCVLVA